MTAAVAAGVAGDTLQSRRHAPRLDDQWVNGRRVGADRGGEFPVDDTRSPSVPYLARVPDCEPPFDDEIEHPPGIRPVLRRAVPGQPVPRPAARPAARPTARQAVRAVAIAPVAPPATPTTRPAAASTSARGTALGVTSRTAAAPPFDHSAGVPAWSEEADIGVRLTTTADLPSAERSASVLARAVIEVLSGRRPLGQLRVHCAPDVYAGLADRPTFASAALPHLISVRVCEPADGVAEVSVAYRRAERVRALAFRIQGVDGRWRMTALQLC